jgi:hypothetical protein
MPNRMGNSVTAILLGFVASVTLIVAADGAAYAADNCLSGPKGAAPKGSHWYYRIDHAAKRNCWYLRAEGEKPVASQNSPVTQASPPAEATLQPSVANARAEAGPADIELPNGVAAILAPSGTAENGQGANVLDTDNGQSTVASRWLDGPSADSKNPSASRPAVSGADVDSSAPPVAEAPLVAADMPSVSSFRAVQTLLLAIVGALAFAGFLVGVIFKFGSATRNDRQAIRPDRRAPWDSIEVDTTTRSPPLATNAPTPRIDVAGERREAIIPNEIVQLLSKLSREAAA